jgi:hypothetical protein
MRHARTDWNLPEDGTLTWQQAEIAVLMDIRDTLDVISRKLSALECPNFQAIPQTLTQIKRNTTKRRRISK